METIQVGYLKVQVLPQDLRRIHELQRKGGYTYSIRSDHILFTRKLPHWIHYIRIKFQR